MLYDPHLDVFLKVAELGSFSKAAEASFITPSAIIKQINLLEADLGVRLFDRTHRGLVLTKAGRSLQKDAPLLMRQSEDIARRAQDAMKKDDNVIRIGLSPVTPVDVLMELWPKISTILPDLKFQLVPFENTPENARMYLKNMGDFIDVVGGLFDPEFLAYRECNGFEISREPLSIALSMTHPLAAKDHLTIEDLYGEELMLLAPSGHMGSMNALRSYLTKHHPQVKIVDFPQYKMDVFNQCENGQRLLVVVPRWKSVHPLLKVYPMDWDFSISYGLLYAKEPEEKVKRFLAVLKKVL